jgi:anti-anti-sigma factor
MFQAARGCELDVERGPDWLFVRPHGASLRGHELDLAEQVWGLLEQSMTHRLVLELDDLGPMMSSVIGQLVMLQKRITSQGGLMRLCGLSPSNQRVLAVSRLSGYLPQYNDRTEAVMGERPMQPR